MPADSPPLNIHRGRFWHEMGSAGSDKPQSYDITGLPTILEIAHGATVLVGVRRSFSSNHFASFVRCWYDEGLKYKDITTSAIYMKPGDIA